jgi:hypothetical protein
MENFLLGGSNGYSLINNHGESEERRYMENFVLG